MKPPFRPNLSHILLLLVLVRSVWSFGVAAAQDAPVTRSAGPLVGASNHKVQAPQPESAPPAAAPPAAAQTVAALPPAPVYDETIFGDRIPAAQIAFLKSFDGNRTRDLYHDKQFKVVKQAVLPKWEFHYGHDMSVASAMDAALADSKDAVQVRDGRYVMLSGTSTLYPGLQGRGFIWVDMQEGIALAGFYFHPTNGEPTPTTTVFSKQLMVDAISMAQLPPEFFQDYSQWNADERLSPVMTRYFIGGLNKRLLLEHDEDFCSSTFAGLGADCLQMTADAADLDMNTAYYLDQVNYATNATAYMLVGSDQTAFLRLRANRCGAVADPLGCRILITRQQIHTISRPVTVRRR
jgi:hypothetical protein